MAKILKVDFSNVEEFGGRIPAGDYVFKVVKVEQKQSKKEGGGAYLNWHLTGVTGDSKGSKLFFITSLKPNALWNLYNFLVAVGIDPGKKKVQIDIDKVVGKFLGATVDDEEYTGKDGKKKKKSAIITTYPVKKTADGKWQKVGVDEEEPEEEDIEEQLDDADLAELEAASTEDDIEPEVEEEKPKQKSKGKNKPAPKPDPEPEEDEEVETGDDDEELNLDDLEDDLADLEDNI